MFKANQATLVVAKTTEKYNPKIPVEVTKLDYLGREIKIWGAKTKRAVAKQIKSKALEADSRQTDLYVYLPAITLGGLALNAMFGWWWADPVAALVIIPIIADEGIQALRGKSCDDC